MAPSLTDEDEGRAPERTELAWTRTAIAAFVAVAALGRRVWPVDEGNHRWIVLAIGVAAILIIGSQFAASRLAIRARYAGETMDHRTFQLVTAGTLVLAAAGLALAILPA